MSSIALVLDPHFGERLLGLAELMPVWIVSSDENSAAVRKARAELGRSAQVTELLAGRCEGLHQVLARGLYDIDQHHGADAGKGYGQVVVYGAAAKDVAGAIMDELGFKHLCRSASGFRLER